MKERDVEIGFVLKLEKGEEVISSITEFCAKRGIRGAIFWGIGAVDNFKIGYYDLGSRDYFFRHEPDTHEVASMQGNVALVDGKPFVHCHAALSKCDESCATIGGHIKEARVAVTLEVYLTSLPTPLQRELDESIGLKLLDL
jgi:uncharacterized protein